jgi:hypothetical protein
LVEFVAFFKQSFVVAKDNLQFLAARLNLQRRVFKQQLAHAIAKFMTIVVGFIREQQRQRRVSPDFLVAEIVRSMMHICAAACSTYTANFASRVKVKLDFQTMVTKRVKRFARLKPVTDSFKRIIDHRFFLTLTK